MLINTSPYTIVPQGKSSLSLHIEGKQRKNVEIIEFSRERKESNSSDSSHFFVRVVYYSNQYRGSLKDMGFQLYMQECYLYKDNPDNHFIPTIHISRFHGFDKKAEQCTELENEVYKGAINAHRFLSVVDSSIWNYYFCIDEKRSQFVDILQSIERNYENHLYELAVSYEYADFVARMMSQNYICGSSDHACIVPFLFHSESHMRSLIDRYEWERSSLNAEWRFLLVDDCACAGLSYASGCGLKNETSDIGKLSIIVNDIINAGLHTNIECFKVFIDASGNPSFSAVLQRNDLIKKTKGGKITIDCVTTVNEAYKLLQSNYRYDLVLLDYKLHQEKDEYGYDLLHIIYKSKGSIQSGPNGRFFFMFISAYTTAVSQRILREGFRISTKYWFLDKGACPTNTPYLFLYSLKRLMDKRYESLIKHGKDLAEIIKLEKTDKPIITAIDFIAALYSSQEEKTVRSRCKNAFNAFLTLRSTYDKIKYDIFDEKRLLDKNRTPNCRFVDKKEKESQLIRSMFPDVICYSNTFWEHMQHLVYLTAYGTNRQWPEMWEELMSVSDILKAAEKSVATYAGISTVKMIRNYILTLKAENSR